MFNFGINSVEIFGSHYVTNSRFGIFSERKPSRAEVKFVDGNRMYFVPDLYWNWYVCNDRRMRDVAA